MDTQLSPYDTRQLSYRLASSFGYLTHAEVTLIKDLAKYIQPNGLCVNIGAGSGTSIIALLEERPDLMVYSVDLTDNGQAQFREAGMEQRIIPIIGDSKQIDFSLYSTEPISWLFVDGGHLEFEILGDIYKWIPRMKHGGIVLFHDYDSPNWSDVKRVVDGFSQMTPSMKNRYIWRHIGTVDTLIAFEIFHYRESSEIPKDA